MMDRGVINRKWGIFPVGILAQGIQPLHAGEMTIERLCRRKIWQHFYSQAKRLMQKASRAGSIHDETRLDLNFVAVTNAPQPHAVTILDAFLQLKLVQVLNSHGSRLPHQKLVKVGAIPVSVGNLIMRACGHKQLASPGYSRLLIPEDVMKKTETPLKSARNLRMGNLPDSPLRKPTDLRQVISRGKRLQ